LMNNYFLSENQFLWIYQKVIKKYAGILLKRTAQGIYPRSSEGRIDFM